MQKENELITKIAAIDAAIEAVDSWGGITSIGREKRIEKYINALPAVVDVVPVVHGKWIRGCDTQCDIACSVCGTPVDDFCHSIDYIDLKYEPDFCPHCGAIMDADSVERE